MRTHTNNDSIKQSLLLTLLRLGSDGYFSMLDIFPNIKPYERKKIADKLAEDGLIVLQSAGSSTIKLSSQGYRRAILSSYQILSSRNNDFDIETTVLIYLLESSLAFQISTKGLTIGIPEVLVQESIESLIGDALITRSQEGKIQLTEKGFVKAISYEYKIAVAEKL